MADEQVIAIEAKRAMDVAKLVEELIPPALRRWWDTHTTSPAVVGAGTDILVESFEHGGPRIRCRAHVMKE